MNERVEINEMIAKSCTKNHDEFGRPGAKYYLVFGVEFDSLQIVNASDEEIFSTPIYRDTEEAQTKAFDMYRDTIKYFELQKSLAKLIFYSVVLLLAGMTLAAVILLTLL